MDFSRADLTRANFQAADVSATIFIGAVLRLANFRQSTCYSNEYDCATDFSGADLRNADFSYANLRSVNFTKTDLRNANFSHAHLQDADLVGANLQGAIFTGADLSSANLCNSQHSPLQFEDAYLHRTIFCETDRALHMHEYKQEVEQVIQSLQRHQCQ